MTDPIWIHAFDHAAEPAAAVARRILRASGLDIERCAHGGPGILFFRVPAPALFAAVRRASGEGRERVLAISVAGGSPLSRAAWELLEAGASDILSWREDGGVCAEIAARFERWREIDELLDSDLIRENLVGRSAAWTRVLRQVAEVAAFTDASMLLLGETGTGKELVARLIHTLDRREKHGELVVVDCANIVPTLAGSEFFGHERGAFTGAIGVREGAFALADGGTLFLDEVGELPLELQGQLLRVIQEHQFKRVGGNTWFETRFRLICATHGDLLERVTRGAFRSDLYYRIAGVICRLPPLRERGEDILPLARHFLREACAPGEPPEFDAAVRELLVCREYPGNVRDLRQLVGRLLSRHVGPGPITAGEVPTDERPASPDDRDWRRDGFEQVVRRALAEGAGLRDITRETADLAIRLALHEEQGSLARAARRLRVTERALQLRRAAERTAHGGNGRGNGSANHGGNGSADRGGNGDAARTD